MAIAGVIFVVNNLSLRYFQVLFLKNPSRLLTAFYVLVYRINKLRLLVGALTFWRHADHILSFKEKVQQMEDDSQLEFDSQLSDNFV
jgi:hypothetical protein